MSLYLRERSVEVTNFGTQEVGQVGELTSHVVAAIDPLDLYMAVRTSLRAALYHCF